MALLRNLLGVGIIAAAAIMPLRRASAQDTIPPVITVTTPTYAECQYNTQEATVDLDATAVDNISPLVSMSYWVGGVGGTLISDPDVYVIGSTAVTIEACDQEAIPNCATELAAVVVNDTTAPSISVPAIETVECTSPAGTAVDLSPVIVLSDICDPLSVTYTLPGAPSLYPVGMATVDVDASDGYGNLAQDAFTLWVRDTVKPVYSPLPANFRLDGSTLPLCDPDGVGPATASDGYMVPIPWFFATDTCTDPGDLLYSTIVPALGETTAAEVCLGIDVPVTLTARVVDLALNVEDQSYTVTAMSAPTLSVTVTAAPTGFDNLLPDTVTADVVGGAGPYTWTAVGGDLTTPFVGPSYTGAVTTEGIYCPAYLSVRDSGVNADGEALCFAKDTTLPQVASSTVTTGEYFYGEELQITIDVTDSGGNAPSGISRIQVGLVPTAGVFAANVYDAPVYTCDQLVRPSLMGCDLERTIVGCNTGTSCNGGLLTLDMGIGTYDFTVELLDEAGNPNTITYAISILKLADGIQDALTDVNALIADINTPLGALNDLNDAKSFLEHAQGFSDEHPGHAMTFSRRAWLFLEQANAAGADTSAILAKLSRAIVSEGKRFVEETDAYATTAVWTDWGIIANEGATPATEERYFDRYFLHPDWTDPATRRLAGDAVDRRDYIVDFATHISDARADAMQAGALDAGGQQLAAIDAAIAAVDGMAVMFDDNIVANLINTPAFVRNPFQVGVVDEAFYNGSIPSDLGVHLANTVAAQVARAATDPSMPAAAVAALNSAATRIAAFATTVFTVQQYYAGAYSVTGFPAGFGNEQVTTVLELCGFRVRVRPEQKLFAQGFSGRSGAHACVIRSA